MKLDPMFLDSLSRFVLPRAAQITERAFYLIDRIYPELAQQLDPLDRTQAATTVCELLATLLATPDETARNSLLRQHGSEGHANERVPNQALLNACADCWWRSAGTYLDSSWTPTFSNQMKVFVTEAFKTWAGALRPNGDEDETRNAELPESRPKQPVATTAPSTLDLFSGSPHSLTAAQQEALRCAAQREAQRLVADYWSHCLRDAVQQELSRVGATTEGHDQAQSAGRPASSTTGS